MSVQGHELLFSFDTGASTGSLTARYFRSFPQQFAALKPTRAAAGGAGGIRFLTAYQLPSIDLCLGAANATLHNTVVYTSDLGTGLLDQLDGNLGLALVVQFRSYTIDFSRMQLCAGSDDR